MATKVHVILHYICRTSVACDTLEFEGGHSPFTFVGVGPLHLAFTGNVEYACTNIQQVEQQQQQQQGDTPHIDTWRNARVWADFFGGLH